jgi:ornithine cyclodeaminase/alanine dehydrogenase-like protein (mu-crystallin family)
MTALYLREADVDRLVDIRTAIEVVEESFQQLAEGGAANIPRTRAKAPGAILHSMSAAAAYLGVLGWKQYTTTRAGAQFLVGLYDQESGRLVALIEASRLGQLRTGAVTAVAAKWSNVIDAAEMGLLGCGYQAETQLAAVASVCPLRRASVYCRNEAARHGFAERMSQLLGIEVVAVDNARDAVEKLPVVVTATNSTVPVLNGEWVRDDAFVAAVGSNWPRNSEVDSTTIRRAGRVICDSIECCRLEAGDLIAAVKSGDFAWEDAVELCDVVSGRVTDRGGKREPVFFKSVGMAIEDIALGARIFSLAREGGIGAELPF